MVDRTATIHCKVLALRQESKEREEDFAKRGLTYDYVAEWRVGAELEQVLRLFKEEEDATE